MSFVNEATYATGGVSPDINPGGGGGGSCNYWTILTSTHDWDGRYSPTRCGDSTIGWSKACYYHNFCEFKTINLTIAGKGDLIDTSGTRYTYRGHAVGYYNGGYYDVTLRVVVDRSKTTAQGSTPDGSVVGTITAYCEGYTECPNAVNNL